MATFISFSGVRSFEGIFRNKWTIKFLRRLQKGLIDLETRIVENN